MTHSGKVSYRLFVVGVLSLVLLSGCGGGGGSGGGDGQITISWNSVSGATSYNIYWSTTSGVTKTTGTKLTGVTSPYTHTGLTNGTTYYVVTAVNSYGESSESSQVSATPQKPINLPKTGQTTIYSTDDGGTLQKGAAWPSPRFTVRTGAEADCITDNLTGLMWVKNPDSTRRTWANALAYSNGLTLCGYSDWRLPPNIIQVKILKKREKRESQRPSLNGGLGELW